MKKAKRKNCIIYGGAGFIGSHIAEDLLKKNLNVTAFDKLNASTRNLTHIMSKIDYIEGDFNNEVDINKSLRNIDYAVHLVSSTLPADSNLNPYYDVETNLISSIHLLENCVKNKIKKVIFISSGGTVYGNPVKLPINENHPTNPTSSYGIIKLTIEKYLSLYKNLKGLDCKILRFANPFGERQNPHLTQGLISNLLYKLKHKMPIEIWGDGKIVRDYFYIGDGAKAVYKAIADKSDNPIYNISSSKGMSVNQILDKFRKVLKLNFDVKANVLDNKLAAKYLKWKPETNFDTALKKTWRYILDHE